MQIWRWFLLPWFLLRLSLVVSPTLFKFAWLGVSKHLLVIVATLFFIGSVIFSLAHGANFSTIPALSRFSPPLPEREVSFELIDKEIVSWEKLHALQPTHRDVLINLAVLYQARGNEEKAQEYLNQAKQLDPNHPLFLNSSSNSSSTKNRPLQSGFQIQK